MIITIRLRSHITAGILAFSLSAASAFGQLVAPAIKTPTVPAGIGVPEGNSAFLKSHAEGTQNYVCLPTATGYAWTFLSPQATLFTAFKHFQGDFHQQIITHFLSPNPSEQGTARVTWQNSVDTSTVWGKAIATSTDPSFVEAGAIPWVLLQVVGAQQGLSGGTFLTPAKYVQRLNTTGGAAPSTGCSQATNVGVTILMPYSADYFFFRPSRKQ